MKLLRHLLSHVLLILLIFGIVSLYYYRHYVLPVKYAEKIDVYAEKIHPKLRDFVRTKKAKEKVASVEVVTQNNLQETELPVEENKELIETKNNEVSTEQELITTEETKLESSVDTSDEDMSVAVNNIDKESTTEKNVQKEDVQKEDVQKEDVLAVQIDKSASVVETVAADTHATDTPEQVTQISSPYEIIETNGAPETDKETANVNDLLRAARMAFNLGDLNGSVTQYNLLIELDNDEADFYGELGNVYYAMGRWKEAGIAYYEAATRLIEKRHLYQVHYLQRVINGLDPERAEKLSAQLASLKY